PSSSAGVQAATQPVLTARAELRTPRPVAAAIGSPSGIRYRRGFAIPAPAASRSTVEWRSGASPTGSSPTPPLPSTTRSDLPAAPGRAASRRRGGGGAARGGGRGGAVRRQPASPPAQAGRRPPAGAAAP